MIKQIDKLYQQASDISESLQQTVYAFDQALEDSEDDNDTPAFLKLLKEAEDELEDQRESLRNLQQLLMLHRLEKGEV